MDQNTSEPPDFGKDIWRDRPARLSPRSSRLPLVLAILGVLAGGGALGVTLWQAAETSRQTLRLSTELAQLRVSLELYARNRPAEPTDNSGVMTELTDRLLALEQAAAAPVAPPVIDGAPASIPAVTASGEDCLPPGMRLLVAMGDNYAICGEDASIEVAMVDNGYITLADGTTVPSGGSMPLPNSACTIGVTSTGDEGLTGYAEIRVSC